MVLGEASCDVILALQEQDKKKRFAALRDGLDKLSAWANKSEKPDIYTSLTLPRFYRLPRSFPTYTLRQRVIDPFPGECYSSCLFPPLRTKQSGTKHPLLNRYESKNTLHTEYH